MCAPLNTFRAYRTVNPEGCVPYLQNFYSVPWQRMGELLPLRITEQELIVYGPDLAEIARHELYPSEIMGEKHTLPEHSPGRDPSRKVELLKERFTELGVEAVRFLEAILQTRRCGKDEALRVLGLLATYGREDLVKALERACRYRAFSFSAVERILAAQARPRSDWEALQDEAREHLDDVLREPFLSPRPTAEYQQLLEKAETARLKSEADDDGEST
jgi:Mu transposase, C-terminal domain